MTTSRSVTQARDELPRLIRVVEQGRAVEITRRGKAVVVLVSIDEHGRLSGGRASSEETCCAWLDGVDREAVAVRRSHFARLREKSPGCDLAL